MPVNPNRAGQSRRTAAILTAAVAASLGVTSSRTALAASSTWDGTAAIGAAGDGSSWSDANNWTTNGVIDTAPSNVSPGDDVTFSGTPSGPIDLGSNRVVNSLSFANAQHQYSLDSFISTNTHTLTVTSGVISVTPFIELGQIFAKVAGSNGLTFNGPGQLNLVGTGLWTGGTTINGGVLSMNGSTLGSGDLTINAGYLYAPAQAFAGNVLNKGTFNANASMTTAAAGQTFTQSGGTYVGNGLNWDGGVFDNLGGSISGSVNLGSRLGVPTLNFGPSASGGGTFQFLDGNANITGDVPLGTTINFRPATTLAGSYTLTAASGFTNNGNLNFRAQTSNSNTTLGFTASPTLTNAGQIVTLPGPTADGLRTIDGYLINQSGAYAEFGAATNITHPVTNSGTFTVDGGHALSLTGTGQTFTQSAGQLTIGGTLTMDAGVFNDNGGTMIGTATLTNTSGSATVNFGAGPFAGSGSFLLTGAGSSAAHVNGNIPAGYTVTYQPSSTTTTTTTLVASSAITNSGTFVLAASGANNNDVFTVGTPSMTLTNAGTFTVNPGPTADGGRTLNATINNIAGGTVNINASTAFGAFDLTSAGAVNIAAGKTLSWPVSNGHVTINGGTMSLAAGAVLDLSGTKSNLNAGSITLAADAAAPAKIRAPGLSFGPTAGTFSIDSGPVAAGQSPGYIELAGSNNIVVSDGSATPDVAISVPITSSNGLTKSGNGSLQLSGASTYTGATTVNTGALTLTATGSLASTSLSVSAHTTLTLNGSVPASAAISTTGTVNFSGNPTNTGTPTRPLASLTITLNPAGIGRANVTASMNPAHPAVLNPTSLTFSGSNSVLDLTNNELITNADAGSIRAMIISHQIITSSAGGVLGYTDIGSGQTEVRFTLSGDTNLDGAVDVGDLGALATNYGATSGAAWDQGDFDYDGQVNVNDLGSLATNFGTSLGSGSAFDAALPTAVSSSVPEPAGLVAVIACGLLLRRRRLFTPTIS